MSETKLNLPLLGETTDPVVTVNQEDLRLYDADTLMNDKENESYRLLNLDAPERPTLTAEGYNEGLFNEEYRKSVEQYIQQKGFDNLKETGEKDVYGRDLVELKDDAGFDFAYTVTREGLFEPAKYNLSDSSMAEASSGANFDAIQSTESTLPEWKQIERSIYQHSTPRMGEFSRYEEIMLPTAFNKTDLNIAAQQSFSGQAVDSLEMWWYQSVGAWDGLRALLGSEDALRDLDEAKYDMAEDISPYTILSLEQIKDIPDALAFVQNMIITQGPDYAIMAGGPAAGAAIGTAILPGVGTAIGGTIGLISSLGYNYLKSTGSVAQEQYYTDGEVNLPEAALVGLGITALDKLGAKGVINPGDFLTKKGMASAVTKYKGQQAAKGRVLSTAEAQREITAAMNSGINRLATDLSIQGSHLLSKRQIALGAGSRILKKGSAEGLTEILQEGLQAGVVQGIPKTAEDWENLGWRLADAGAAGGIVGTAYNSAGTLLERNRIENLRDGVSHFDNDRSPFHIKLAMDVNRALSFNTLESQLDKVRFDQNQFGEENNLENRAERGQKKSYLQRSLDKLTDGKYIPLLSAIKNTFRGYLYDKNGRVNPYAAILAQVEGAYQVLAGGTLYNKEQSKLSQVMLAMPWLNDPMTHFNMDVNEFSSFIDKFIQLDGDISKFNDNEKEVAKVFNRNLAGLAKYIANQYEKADLNHLAEALRDNYMLLLQPGLPDLQKITDNSQDFKERLANHKVQEKTFGVNVGEKFGEANADQLLNMIMNGSAYDAIKLLNQIGAFPSIQEFYASNSFENLRNRIVKDVGYATRTEYRGKNNEVVSNLINLMVKDGYITNDEADAMAADMMMQIKKHSHDFGKLRNKTFSNVQDIARTATSFGLMDMIMFAQFAEAMVAFIGTNQGLAKSLAVFAKNFTVSVKNSLPIIKKKREKARDIQNLDDFEELHAQGYNSDELILQQGADINNKAIREMQKRFYRLVMLEQTTDAIRVSRMVLATDVIHQLIEEIVNADLNNPTKNQARVIERLVYYGVDVPKVVSLYRAGANIKNLDNIPESLQAEFQEMWQNVVPKFVDEFTVRIKPGSRPTIFEDQRFGLPFFTQYLSFISHFHANQLPRLYTAYLKDASAPMAFNTFKFMIGMVLIAYISQYLKDLLIRGEINPNLEKDTGAIQRAIQYSGLTGWGQDIYDQTMGNPYGFSSDGVFDYLLNAPTISHFSKIAKDISDGDLASAAQRGLPFGDFLREESAPARAINFFINE